MAASALMNRPQTNRSRPRASVGTASVRRSPVPRELRQRVEALLEENYAFMDSPIFRRRNIEAELFTFDNDQEPALPRTAWYQPTRDEMLDAAIVGAPQLMKGDEEKLMFLRYNYTKLRLGRLQRKIKA